MRVLLFKLKHLHSNTFEMRRGRVLYCGDADCGASLNTK